jgi:hypothetical protein
MKKLSTAQKACLAHANVGRKIFHAGGWGEMPSSADIGALQKHNDKRQSVTFKSLTLDSLVRNGLMEHGDGFNEYQITKAGKGRVARFRANYAWLP